MTYSNDRDTLINDLEGNVNVDSDCEDESTGVDNGPLKEKNEEEGRAVLTTWSFSAYAHFLVSPSLREMTSSPAGNLFSFIAART